MSNQRENISICLNLKLRSFISNLCRYFPPDSGAVFKGYNFENVKKGNTSVLLHGKSYVTLFLFISFASSYPHTKSPAGIDLSSLSNPHPLNMWEILSTIPRLLYSFSPCSCIMDKTYIFLFFFLIFPLHLVLSPRVLSFHFLLSIHPFLSFSVAFIFRILGTEMV